jgi:hypothetical protein
LSLSHLVESIWDHEVAVQPESLDRVLPTTNACMIINLAEDESRVCDPDTFRCQRFSGFTLDGRATGSASSTRQSRRRSWAQYSGLAERRIRERLDCLLNQYVNVEDLLGHPKTMGLRQQLIEAGTAEARLAILNGWMIARDIRRSPLRNSRMRSRSSIARRMSTASPPSRGVRLVASTSARAV